ncbi:glycosyltransferase [Clostridium perfringens]|nr:glycosyltransferase [Clostridium perfringens]
MRILIITNILTPYRVFFFDKLYKYIKITGGELKVAVMAETEPNRNWNYKDFERCYTELIDSISINLKGDIFIHIPKNISDILINFKPNKVIVGGSYQNPAIMKLVKYKTKLNYELIFWSESHLSEEKGYNKVKVVIRDIFRKLMISKFNSFCVPGLMAKEFIEEYKKGGKYYSIPNIVDDNYYSKAYISRGNDKEGLKKKYKIDKDKYVFILPARLAPVKGILEFLEIYKKVVNKKNAIILIAGTGWLKEKIESLCESENLDVRLLGSKNQDEMIELYTMADCLLLPSLSDPNPLSCIEALWAGLPLLVSNRVGNYNETVNEGENGYVFSYENPEESIKIVDNIILSDKKWNNNAQEVSRAIAKKYFSPDIVVKRLINQLSSKEEL